MEPPLHQQPVLLLEYPSEAPTSLWTSSEPLTPSWDLTSTSISHLLDLVSHSFQLVDIIAEAGSAVGDLRFALPKPAVYASTINATINGPACLQAAPDYASGFGDLVGPYGMSEDCLQLNVLVPRDVITIGTGMPVLVFVHGGGFFGGSANSVDGGLLVSTATKLVCHHVSVGD